MLLLPWFHDVHPLSYSHITRLVLLLCAPSASPSDGFKLLPLLLVVLLLLVL